MAVTSTSIVNDEAPTVRAVRASVDSTPSKGIGTVKKASTEVLESEMTV